MNSTILVTGGTGTLGRRVVPLLRDTDAEVRVLSRTPHESEGVDHLVGDLETDEGIDAAVDGVDTVLHLAGGPKGDEAATRNLMRAAAHARVRHVVYISVVAADRVPLTYFRSKAAAEQTVVESGLPWTMLRAAQFHELILTVVRGLARSPVVPVPRGIRVQPVDSREVAARLAGLTLAEPAGRVPDLAGPDVHDAGELVRGWLRTIGRSRPTIPVRMPGRAGRAYRAGDNLNLETAELGVRTWDDFVTELRGSAACPR